MTFGILERPPCLSPKPVDLYVFRRGRHSGKTFKHVADTDPHFCAWVLCSSERLTGAMSVFREYLLARDPKLATPPSFGTAS